MADVIWPAGLPQAPQVAKYSQVDQDRTVRTSMDVGPAKVRRRATAAIETCEIELRLTRAQVATLKTFFRDTAQAGAVAFEWKHHETGQQVDYRFVGPPTFTPSAPRQAGTEIWSATFQLEAMPGTLVVTPPIPPPPAPADPPWIMFEELAPGANARTEQDLQPIAVMYFDEPDAITPAPDDSPLVFVGDPHPEEESLAMAIIGMDADAGTPSGDLSGAGTVTGGTS